MSGEGGNGTISTTGTGDEGLLMSVIEHIPWYRDVEIILMILLGIAAAIIYWWYRNHLKHEIKEIGDKVHQHDFIMHLQKAAKGASQVPGMGSALKVAQDQISQVENKTQTDLSLKQLAHAWHVLPWYWELTWVGGSVVLTSLGMTVLVVIPGFFLFSNLLWVVVVLRCNKERLNTAAELDRLEHSSERKQQHMRQLFEEIDADGNGTLDAEEVTLFAKQLDDSLEFSVEEITKAMLAMDSDGDGAVTFEEFNEWFEAFTSNAEEEDNPKSQNPMFADVGLDEKDDASAFQSAEPSSPVHRPVTGLEAASDADASASDADVDGADDADIEAALPTASSEDDSATDLTKSRDTLLDGGLE